MINIQNSTINSTRRYNQNIKQEKINKIKNDKNKLSTTELSNALTNIVEPDKRYLLPLESKIFKHISKRHNILVEDSLDISIVIACIIPIIETHNMSQTDKNSEEMNNNVTLILVPSKSTATDICRSLKKIFFNSFKCKGISTECVNDETSLMNVFITMLGLFVTTISDFEATWSITIDKIKQIDTVIMYKLAEANDFDSTSLNNVLQTLYKDAKCNYDGHSRTQFILLTIDQSLSQEILEKFTDSKFYNVRIYQDRPSSFHLLTQHHFIMVNSNAHRFNCLHDIVMCYTYFNKRAILYIDMVQDCDIISIKLSKRLKIGVLLGNMAQMQQKLLVDAFNKGSYDCLITDKVHKWSNADDICLILNLSLLCSRNKYNDRTETILKRNRKCKVITLITSNERQLLADNTYTTNLELKELSIPTSKDVIEALNNRIIHRIRALPQSYEKEYETITEDLLKLYKPKEVINKAFAICTDYEEHAKQKSLLSLESGFVTYTIEFNRTIDNITYIINTLLVTFGDKIFNNIKEVKMFADRTGAVFDINEAYCENINEKLIKPHDFIKIYKTNIIPELEKEDNSMIKNNAFSLPKQYSAVFNDQTQSNELNTRKAYNKNQSNKYNNNNKCRFGKSYTYDNDVFPNEMHDNRYYNNDRSYYACNSHNTPIIYKSDIQKTNRGMSNQNYETYDRLIAERDFSVDRRTFHKNPNNNINNLMVKNYEENIISPKHINYGRCYDSIKDYPDTQVYYDDNYKNKILNNPVIFDEFQNSTSYKPDIKNEDLFQAVNNEINVNHQERDVKYFNDIKNKDRQNKQITSSYIPNLKIGQQINNQHKIYDKAGQHGPLFNRNFDMRSKERFCHNNTFLNNNSNKQSPDNREFNQFHNSLSCRSGVRDDFINPNNILKRTFDSKISNAPCGIFLKRLDRLLTSYDIRNYFENKGYIVNHVNLFKNFDGSPKGIAIVHLNNAIAVEHAILHLNNTYIGSSRVTIELAKDRFTE